MTTPKLALTDGAVAKLTVEALIIGTVAGPDGVELAPGSEQVAAAFDGDLAKVLASLGATGKADEVVKLPAGGKLRAEVLVAAGLGKPADDGPSAESVRRGSGAAARALTGVSHAATTLSAVDLSAAVQGTVLGAYAFSRYKSQPGDEPVSKVDLVVADAKDDATRATLKGATAIAEAVSTARDLINTPPNDLYPASFADRASELGRGAGLEVEVLDDNALRKQGYGGILGVGSGSSRPPRLVRLRHKGPKGAKKVALIGKGITFDTGGISLKPGANMDEMTSDMSGAAAVIATMVLAARLNYPIDITATVPMAENMPSGTAYRPGDVLTMYGGKTVEVLNTDAEGRLILADAIVRACEDEPDYLVETSTLTGAQVVALGKRTPGVMGTDEFRDRVAELSQAVGEGAWAMPMPEELRGDLDSRLADLANITGHRWGGMLAAGLFLREFVAEGVPWAHIDIAGPAYNSGSPWGYTAKGGTGVPVRTLAAVLADIADHD
ncbi:leucyl aminopeptidase [Saccharopolyspora erythraea NRRL 2338]|uniref:Probable cytosol aminopeptidase n=2 Tax=Saccharopolyspora erythraea TaxID=1836 RepID=A4FA86_SACEN|nr:leucyl aminopeptidase [Saccharopolyspora erythraea]EQD81665.1 aminopeptidase A [Saccharopolyspora erythraea D]PFG94747.1 leucyl aminopeptidase [Saccharopolyspora erythraea NRRL 2338]QRK91469.1 leucyl aminopeptidase [Saccharopolyspora erythraea]CAM00961.1 leucyl aminopeptidase [Saccharopolyspora erythraea NRRL 2338]